MSSVDIDQIKNETDMINLSQAQLKNYADKVSTLVKNEESTIKGLENERIYYEGLEYQVGNEIDRLTRAITISSFELSQQQQQESTLAAQSTLVQDQIDSTIKAIEAQDKLISDTGGEISSLTSERNTIQGQIIESDNAFRSAAATYSDRYTEYIQKVGDYETLLRNINNTCTLLISSAKVAADSQKVWEQSASTLDSYDRQMSTLKREEQAYVDEGQRIQSDIDAADRALLSTFASVENWSSFLTTALMNKRYLELVSSLQADLKEASDATEVYNRYFQRFMSQTQIGGAIETGPIIDIPMSDSELSTMVAQQKRQMDTANARVAQRRTEVNNASTTLESAGMSSFEVVLSGYDRQLAFEYSTLYHYRELGKQAREVDIPYYTTLRNSTYTAALTAMSNSKMYSEAYISTFIGYHQMLDNEFQLEGQVLSNADDAYYAERNLIEYVTNLCGPDYLPMSAIRNAVNTYTNANLMAYQSKRQGWTPGAYMTSLAAEQAALVEPIIEVIDITGPIITGTVIEDEASVAKASTLAAQYLDAGLISSFIANGDISSLATQNVDLASFAAKGDFSSINSMLSVTQRGGQATGSSTDDEIIDQNLANEIFDLTYLLYSQGTPGVPSSLRLNNETVSFVTPPPYVPRSVKQFGPMGGDISSLAGYEAISTQKAQEYIDAMTLAGTYNMQYISVSQAVSRFEIELSNTLNDLQKLGLDSTLYIENINKLNIQLAKEGVDLLNAFNEQEKAAYEYRESYVREKRVEIQNQYEDAIQSEISRQSSLKGVEFAARGDTSSVVDYLQLINFDTGIIALTYSNFQNITTALGTFSNLYQRYDNRGLELSNYTSNSSNYITQYNEYSELVMSNITNPQAVQLSLIASKYTTLSNTKNILDQSQAKFPDLTAAINQQKPIVDSNYAAYVPESKRNDIERDISSFLRTAYEEGYASFTV